MSHVLYYTSDKIRHSYYAAHFNFSQFYYSVFGIRNFLLTYLSIKPTLWFKTLLEYAKLRCFHVLRIFISYLIFMEFLKSNN